jgi:two-component system, response regulator YesN
MSRKQVLLVDDDQVLREVIELFLRDVYEVKTAATGMEALAVLQRQPIAVVVLDYRLPDRSGLEVLAEIRSIRPHIPVIMISGFGSEVICASAFKIGVDDYLPKPLDLAELTRCVHQVTSHETAGPGAGPTPLAGGEGRERNLAIQKVVAIVHRRYWEQLSLSTVAAEVAMSRYHLSHRFRAVMGTTFRAYLLRVRLERAKTLLARPEPRITEVALAVGFGDLCRFDKLFKRYTGVTPSHYRTAPRRLSA